MAPKGMAFVKENSPKIWTVRAFTHGGRRVVIEHEATAPVGFYSDRGDDLYSTDVPSTVRDQEH